MALISPGVEVSVIDESFYTPAEPGTRPLIIVASAENKLNAAGNGVAVGTLKSNAGKVYLVTSQRELADIFGDPTFRVDSNNNPIHGGELNEYGLQAAYSYLGVSNSAFVVRADIDLNTLSPLANPPGGTPNDGTFWLDTAISTWGIFEWDGGEVSANGQAFNSKTPVVVSDSVRLEDGPYGLQPKSSYGAIGSYAMVAGDGEFFNGNTLRLFYKNPRNEWVLVGSNEWTQSWPTVQGKVSVTSVTSGKTIQINGGPVVTANTNMSVQSFADLITDAYASLGIVAGADNSRLQLFADNSVESISVSGTAAAELGISAGAFFPPKLTVSPHTKVPTYKKSDATPRPTGSVWLKTTEPNRGARLRVKMFNSALRNWQAIECPLYADNNAANVALDASGGGINIPFNTVYGQVNVGGDTNPLADYRVLRRAVEGATVVRTAVLTDDHFVADDSTGVSFTLRVSVVGSTTMRESVITFDGTGPRSVIADALANAILEHALPNIEVSVDSQNRVVIEHTAGGEIEFVEHGMDGTVGLLGLDSTTASNINVYRFVRDGVQGYVASGWRPLEPNSVNDLSAYFISSVEPATTLEDGQIWYSSIAYECDIMTHNGEVWVGYQNAYPETNPTGPIVAAAEPLAQTDGTPLVDNDLWIDTSDLENYPLIKRYRKDAKVKWEVVDVSDQTTENGIVFADARWSTAGANSEAASIEDLLRSNYVDFDCPQPALYPRGMLLWNLRRSGFNVKKFVRNYIDVNIDNPMYKADFNDVGNFPTSGDSQADYYPHRWVTISGNQSNGAGSFGRKAQRKVVQQALQALVNTNEVIRDEDGVNFNLLACPGYPELMGEMISLNYDRGLSAFIVGDSPARLKPDATSINEWANNVRGAAEDGDEGLVSFDEYLGVFYPWGFTSDNAGRDAVVPPSHMILRTIALSDQVSYPWFAAAGTRRGGITNATSVGYVTSEGEFQTVSLNEGQRDVLYTQKINPITFLNGVGLVNFGQKTRARNASAMDRINVVRLVIYLRSQLSKLSKPFLFEPNDKLTRDEFKQQVDSLLLELVGQRAITDFLTVCDTSNNTPSRIDRNELWLDLAIVPTKAVEFIYIPVRLKNTGEI